MIAVVRAGLRLAVLTLILVAGAIAAVAQDCHFGPDSADRALTEAEFYQLPIGSMALGGFCNVRDYRCEHYYDISACGEVEFALSLSGWSNRLYYIFNSMSECRSVCDWVDSFLQLAVIYPYGASEVDYDPFVELKRNGSDRWHIYNRRTLSTLPCCTLKKGEDLFPLDFLAMEGPNAQEDKLYTDRKLAWHSALTPSGSPEAMSGRSIFSLLGNSRPTEKTWDYRTFYWDLLAACPKCSAKLAMLRFQETVAGDGVERPSWPVFQYFSTLTYSRVHLWASVPFADGAYDRDVVINLIR